MAFVNYLKLFIAAFIVLVLLDLIWFRLFMGTFFRQELASIARPAGQTSIPSALAAWALLSVGIVFLVLPRIAPGAVWWHALLWGALFGLVVYGTYDFTNYAILKDYPFRFLAVDVLWGTVICGITTLAVSRLALLLQSG